jgi:hypothetical protein
MTSKQHHEYSDLCAHLRIAAGFVRLRPPQNADAETMEEAADVIDKLMRAADETPAAREFWITQGHVFTTPEAAARAAVLNVDPPRSAEIIHVREVK